MAQEKPRQQPAGGGRGEALPARPRERPRSRSGFGGRPSERGGAAPGRRPPPPRRRPRLQPMAKAPPAGPASSTAARPASARGCRGGDATPAAPSGLAGTLHSRGWTPSRQPAGPGAPAVPAEGRYGCGHRPQVSPPAGVTARRCHPAVPSPDPLRCGPCCPAPSSPEPVLRALPAGAAAREIRGPGRLRNPRTCGCMLRLLGARLRSAAPANCAARMGYPGKWCPGSDPRRRIYNRGGWGKQQRCSRRALRTAASFWDSFTGVFQLSPE